MKDTTPTRLEHEWDELREHGRVEFHQTNVKDVFLQKGRSASHAWHKYGVKHWDRYRARLLRQSTMAVLWDSMEFLPDKAMDKRVARILAEQRAIEEIRESVKGKIVEA